jgi:hypothetical protein
VGGACGTHRRGEKSVQGLGGESPKERGHSEDQGVGGRMGSEWIFAGGCELDSTGSG